MSRKLELIEFTADTDKRRAGDRLRVDPRSAVGFCDTLKVARRVDATTPAPAPVIPAPEPVVDAEPEDTTPAGVDDAE